LFNAYVKFAVNVVQLQTANNDESPFVSSTNDKQQTTKQETTNFSYLRGMNPTVSFHTLGCKLNFAETSTIGQQLRSAGFVKKNFDEGSDVVVINTCSVTENADRECRTIVRRALQKNPDAFVAIIGCYAQLKPDEIDAIDGVDLVLGAKEKFNLIDYLTDFRKRKNTEIHSCTIGESDIFHSAYSTSERTRAFLKVQDGCDYPCTYCTIPLARGSSRSATIEEVIANAEKIASEGIREIVLTGVNIGDYGIMNVDSPRANTFLELIHQLDNVEGIERFRISSIEPNLLTDEIIDFVVASKRFAPHFHIPLQSGSDKILGLMRRRYRKNLYEARVAKIKSVMPDACIGVDVIVGFPGDTDEDFLDTYNFLNGLDVSYLHVFTYSERDNTPAAEMDGVVPVTIRKQRNKMLRILSDKKRQHFYRSQIGKSLTALFEHHIDDKNMMSGFTENYVRVRMPAVTEYINSTVHVTLDSFDGGIEVECRTENPDTDLTPVTHAVISNKVTSASVSMSLM
jgi:threonylcarbamoyladenosine tRNA methylthiotransferase MtaB